MSKSLLAASLCVVFGTSMAYTAGLMGVNRPAGWMLVAGSVVCLLGVIGEGMSAYAAGRQDRDDELDSEMYDE